MDVNDLVLHIDVPKEHNVWPSYSHTFKTSPNVKEWWGLKSSKLSGLMFPPQAFIWVCEGQGELLWLHSPLKSLLSFSARFIWTISLKRSSWKDQMVSNSLSLSLLRFQRDLLVPITLNPFLNHISLSYLWTAVSLWGENAHGLLLSSCGTTQKFLRSLCPLAGCNPCVCWPKSPFPNSGNESSLGGKEWKSSCHPNCLLLEDGGCEAVEADPLSNTRPVVFEPLLLGIKPRFHRSLVSLFQPHTELVLVSF